MLKNKKAAPAQKIKIPENVALRLDGEGNLEKARANDQIFLPLDQQLPAIIYALQAFMAPNKSADQIAPHAAALISAIMRKTPNATRRDYIASNSRAAHALSTIGKPTGQNDMLTKLRTTGVCTARLKPYLK